jgi:hypothetical protein
MLDALLLPPRAIAAPCPIALRAAADQTRSGGGILATVGLTEVTPRDR